MGQGNASEYSCRRFLRELFLLPAAGGVEGEAGDGRFPVSLSVLKYGVTRLKVPHFDRLLQSQTNQLNIDYTLEFFFLCYLSCCCKCSYVQQ